MDRLRRQSSSGPGVVSGFELARLCYTCGICVGGCPASRFSAEFNPRQIMIRVSLGLGEELLGSGSPVWKCTTCYLCSERCPAGVKPLDVILALRNASYRSAGHPRSIDQIRKDILEKGHVGVLTRRLAETRRSLGLGDAADQPDHLLERLLSET